MGEAFHQAEREVARLKFLVNFGSEACERCEGLKAGPGVAATCYQIKLCRYGNVKDAPNEKQKNLLQRILKSE